MKKYLIIGSWEIAHGLKSCMGGQGEKNTVNYTVKCLDI